MYQSFPTSLIGMALLTTFCTPSAVAQDAIEFEGARAEIGVGLDQLRFDLSTFGETGRAKSSDLGYGLTLGYDRAVSPTMLIGVEGGLTLSDVGYGDDVLRRRRGIDLAARVGTPITPNALLYGKAGYSNLQLRENGQVGEVDGLLLGAGLEVKLSPTAYVKSEYRYYDYARGYTSSAIVTGLGIRF